MADNVVSITVRATDATRGAFDHVNRSARDVGDNFRNMFSRVGDGFKRLGDGFGTVFGKVGQGFKALGDGFGTVFGKIGAGFKAVWDKLGGLGEKLKAIGKGFGEFFEGPHGTLLKVAGIIAALPLVAQTAASAITLGIGGAIGGIGIMAAAQNEKVKKSFAALKEHVTSELKTLAKPFVPELRRVASIFEETFDKLSPALGRAFAKMAPVLTGFAEHLAAGFEKFGPVIEGVSAKFGPLMNVLGAELQTAIEHLAFWFGRLADAADPRFVSMLMSAFTGLLDVVMSLVEGLARVGSGIAWLVDKIPGINFDTGTKSSRKFSDALLGMTDSANTSTAAVAGLTQKMLDLANAKLGARGAARSFEAAIDAVTASVKKNGRTLDTNTEKGRNNQQVLDAIASTALDMRDKLIKAGKDPAAAMARARREFIAAAMQMGRTGAQARKLASDLGLIPQRIDIKVAFHGAADATYAAKGLTPPGKASGGIIGAAGGGPRSNMTWVGEQGPELVRLPYGSTVYSTGDSTRMAQGDRIGPARRTVEEIGKAIRPAPGSESSVLATGLQALKSLMDALDGKISTIRAKMNAALSAIKRQLDGGAEDRMVAWAKRQIDQMEKLATLRDQWAKKLEEARNYAKDVAKSMTDSASLSSLGPSTGIGIKVGLENKLAQMKSFAKALKDLAKRGLAKSFLRQIVEQGPEAGLQLAQEFLAMDKQTFTDVNALQKQIEKTAGGIGRDAAQQQYNVKEAERQEAMWQRRMERLAKLFGGRIEQVLRGDHRRRMRDSVRNVGRIQGTQRAAGGPAGGWTLAGEDGPELIRLPYGSSVAPASNTRRMAAAQGNAPAPIHVHLNLDGRPIAEVIVDPLRGVIRSIAGSGPNSVQMALG